MLYSDGIRVACLGADLYDAARELFSDIWLNHNVLYRTAGISRSDFGEYVDVLLARSAADSKTAAVALDTTQDPPLLVSVVFAKDLHFDPVAEKMKQLPKSLDPIFLFNQEALEHFTDNNALSYLNKAGNIVYFLHGGTRDDYAGRYCDGLSISTRAGAFLVSQWIQEGYVGSIGVSTHPEMIRRSELGVQQDHQSICITTKPFSSWKYHGTRVFETIQGAAFVEFKSWQQKSKI